MRIIIMGIIAIVSYILQSTFLEYVEIYGIKPNLIIITTISYALIRGEEEGFIYGLFSGLLVDIMAGKVIGLHALLGMYLGLIIGRLNKNLYKENYLIPIILTACGTFVYNLFYYVFTHSSTGENVFMWYLMSCIIPETIYNSVLAVIIYFFILYIDKKIDYNKRISKSF